MNSPLLDLGNLLQSWPYRSEDNVRRMSAPDGRELIFVRLPLGFEQYQIEGRPDGQRPQGMDSLLDVQQARLAAAKSVGAGNAFRLSPPDCAALFDEGRIRCRRAVLFLHLKDWTHLGRDTAWVLGMLDFVERCAKRAEDRAQAKHWRPDITRLNKLVGIFDAPETHCSGYPPTLLGTILGRARNGWEHRNPSLNLPEALPDALREISAVPNPHRLVRRAAFKHQGDYWTVCYQGQVANLKQSCGMRYLACLLRNPGREFHVCELRRPPVELPLAVEASGHGATLPHGASLQDGVPALDARAKADYKCRLDELRSDLEEAECCGDPGRAAEARAEMELIARHIASAIGLGGRDRKTGSTAERARSAVTKRIKETNTRIAEAIPALGRHLSVRIKTGYFCSYNPVPDRAVAWEF